MVQLGEIQFLLPPSPRFLRTRPFFRAVLTRPERLLLLDDLLRQCREFSPARAFLLRQFGGLRAKALVSRLPLAAACCGQRPRLQELFLLPSFSPPRVLFSFL